MVATVQPDASAREETLLLDERTTARLLGVSSRTLWTLSAAGEIPFVRIGRRKLYSRETLVNWIRTREAEGKSQQRQTKQ
ncbi:MAG TPA: helix-turn-helix domain-containing protein [Pirellulaceae bacterium]|nr:helix-turn-helix domain-containing protein [Pirellulaceae bacterium]